MSSDTAGLNRGERTHNPATLHRPALGPKQRHAMAHAASLSTTRFFRARHTEGRPVPAFLARGQTGPVQSPPGAGHARTQPPLLHSGSRSRAGLSWEARVKGRARERGASATLGGLRPGYRPFPCARAAGARVGLGGQVRGGPTENESRPAPRTPGSGARRPERRARAGEGQAMAAAGEKEDRGPGRAAHSPGLGPPSAGAGFLPEPRSFLPFPLPLPSLRSDISPEKCTFDADGSGEGDARQVWCEGLDRVWEKFVPRGGERAARLQQSRRAGASPVACGERRGRGVRSGPPGTGGRSVRRSP